MGTVVNSFAATLRSTPKLTTEIPLQGVGTLCAVTAYSHAELDGIISYTQCAGWWSHWYSIVEKRKKLTSAQNRPHFQHVQNGLRLHPELKRPTNHVKTEIIMWAIFLLTLGHLAHPRGPFWNRIMDRFVGHVRLEKHWPACWMADHIMAARSKLYSTFLGVVKAVTCVQ